jgi:glycosyltransferase involved in cell wall biosynthesis
MLNPSHDSSIYSVRSRTISSASFVWVCENDEEESITTLRRYLEAIRQLDMAHELVIVNNGQGPRLNDCLQREVRDAGVKALIIDIGMANSESNSLSAAFKHVAGDVVVLLPKYVQVDPQDILRMLDAIRDGMDYVASWRTPRVDARREVLKSQMFNRVTAWLSGMRLHDINSSLRAMRRDVIEHLPLYGDLHIYLPILAARQGFRVGEVPVRHLEERPNRTGQGAGVYLRRGLDLLTLFFLLRFTHKPFRFFGGIGSLLLLAGGGINLVMALQRMIFEKPMADRPLLVFATLLMVLGIQSLSLGLIGELIIFVSSGGLGEYQIEEIYESQPGGDQDVP